MSREKSNIRDEIFRASRFSLSNLIFPTQIQLSPNFVVITRLKWFSKERIRLSYSQISYVYVWIPFFGFATIYLNVNGSPKTFKLKGYSIFVAYELKTLLESELATGVLNPYQEGGATNLKTNLTKGGFQPKFNNREVW